MDATKDLLSSLKVGIVGMASGNSGSAGSGGSSSGGSSPDDEDEMMTMTNINDTMDGSMVSGGGASNSAAATAAHSKKGGKVKQAARLVQKSTKKAATAVARKAASSVTAAAAVVGRKAGGELDESLFSADGVVTAREGASDDGCVPSDEERSEGNNSNNNNSSGGGSKGGWGLLSLSKSASVDDYKKKSKAKKNFPLGEGQPTEEKLRMEAEKMKSGRIKRELEKRGVDASSFVERPELVSAYVDAMISGRQTRIDDLDYSTNPFSSEAGGGDESDPREDETTSGGSKCSGDDTATSGSPSSAGGGGSSSSSSSVEKSTCNDKSKSYYPDPDLFEIASASSDGSSSVGDDDDDDVRGDDLFPTDVFDGADGEGKPKKTNRVVKKEYSEELKETFSWLMEEEDVEVDAHFPASAFPNTTAGKNSEAKGTNKHAGDTPDTAFSTPPVFGGGKSRSKIVEVSPGDSPEGIETQLMFDDVDEEGFQLSGSRKGSTKGKSSSSSKLTSPASNMAAESEAVSDSATDSDEEMTPIQAGLEHLLSQKTEKEGYVFLQGMVLDLMKEVDALMLDGEESGTGGDKKTSSHLLQTIQEREAEVACLRSELNLLSKDYRENLFDVLTALRNASGENKEHHHQETELDKHEALRQLSEEYPPARVGEQATPIHIVVNKLTGRIQELMDENDELTSQLNAMQERVDDLESINEARLLKNQALEQQFKSLNSSRNQLAMKLIGERKPVALGDRTNCNQ